MMRLWNIAFYVGASWSLAEAQVTTVTTTTSMCFPEIDKYKTVPYADRVNITIDGRSMPLGLYWLEWGSAISNAELFRIYTEELVGIHVNEMGHSVVVESGNWAVAGCPGPSPGVGANPGPGCDLKNNPVSTAHVVLETWDFYMGPALAALEAHYKDRMPLDMGDVGFNGVSSNWVPRVALDKAYNDSGLALHAYTGYDDRWWKPFEYLDSLDTVNTSYLFNAAANCQDYPPMNDHQMSLDYVKYVGDSVGMKQWVNPAGEIKMMANCQDGKWWLSPRCRANRTHCIPYISYSGWGMSGIIQKSTEFNMAVAMISMVDYNDWVNAVKNNKVLTYWWIPDAAFVDTNLELIVFPRLNADQHAMGHFITEFGAVQCIKWAHVHLQRAHPRVFQSLLNHKIRSSSMMEILTEHHAANGNMTYRQAACNWMRRNWDDVTVWRNWVPDPKSCLVGQGLTTNKRGEVICDWCPQATSSQKHPDPNLPLSRLCLPCAPGTYQELSGQSECLPCEQGTFTDRNASDGCSRCPVGTYQDQEGQTGCTSCDSVSPSMTTRIEGASKPGDCACPRLTYLNHDGDCEACTEGQVCEAFNMTFPMQEEGYFLQNISHYPAWRCKGSTECPAGLPATCGVHRDLEKVACAQCETGAFKSDAGICEPCGDAGSRLPLFFLFLVAFMVLPVIHAAVNYPLAKTSRPGMQTVFLGGMAVTTVMTINIYQRMDMQWVHPLSTFYSIMRIFAFNLSIMRFSCVVGSDAQVPQYISKILTIPVGFTMLILATSAVYMIKPIRQFAYMSVPYFTNTMGLLFSIFFIPVSLLSLEPFQCVSHPSGFRTLAHDRSVVCFEDDGGEHSGLVILSVIAILVYPVSFLTVTGVVTYNYRRWMNQYGVTFSRRARFLTNRMDPDLYFFGFFYNVRNFSLTLAPVLFPNSFGAQVFVLLLIFIVWHNTSSFFHPWRFRVLNNFDAFTNTIHIIVLVCFALLADTSGTSSGGELSKAEIGWLVICVFTVCMISLAVVGIKKVYQRMNGKKEFGTFLSHHKAAAGLTARRMKMLLQDMTTGKHFLDVDELTNLDNLLFTVRSNTENLVVLMTPEILSRFWCAAEITCSFINRVPITMIAVDKQYEFEGKYLDNVEMLWSEVQLAEFTKADMTMKDIESAYKFLSMQPQIQFKTNADNASQQKSMELVIKNCARRPLKQKLYAPDPERKLYVSFDVSDSKQHMVAHILCQLFVTANWTCQVCESPDANTFRGEEAQSQLGVVLISKGVPDDVTALASITAVYKNGWPFVCVQSQEEFTKPDSNWFRDMSKGKILSAAQMGFVSKVCGPTVSGDDIAKAMKALYRVLAWRINPEGGEKVMMQEFLNIYMRVESESVAKRDGVNGALVFQDQMTIKSDSKSDIMSFKANGADDDDRLGLDATKSKQSVASIISDDEIIGFEQRFEKGV